MLKRNIYLRNCITLIYSNYVLLVFAFAEFCLGIAGLKAGCYKGSDTICNL